MNGDVTVLGLHPGTCVLEDIGMDVPNGTSVTIPADKALRSKDLNRCISQRMLFRLDNGTVLVPKSMPHPLSVELDDLRLRCRLLEEENQKLRVIISQHEASQQGKLDAILTLLQSGVSVTSLIPRESILTPSTGQGTGTSGVVEMEAPAFVPSKIRPDDFGTAHVQLEKTSSDSGLSEAASRLREIRKQSP